MSKSRVNPTDVPRPSSRERIPHRYKRLTARQLRTLVRAGFTVPGEAQRIVADFERAAQRASNERAPRKARKIRDREARLPMLAAVIRAAARRVGLIAPRVDHRGPATVSLAPRVRVVRSLPTSESAGDSSPGFPAPGWLGAGEVAA